MNRYKNHSVRRIVSFRFSSACNFVSFEFVLLKIETSLNSRIGAESTRIKVDLDNCDRDVLPAMSSARKLWCSIRCRDGLSEINRNLNFATSNNFFLFNIGSPFTKAVWNQQLFHPPAFPHTLSHIVLLRAKGELNKLLLEVLTSFYFSRVQSAR